MLNITRIEHAFSSPIIYVKVDNHLKLNELLIKEAYDWKKSDDGVNVSNKGSGWQSPPTLLQRETTGFKNFREIMLKAAALSVSNLNSKLKIEEYNYKANAWININKKGGYNAAHHHGEFHLSGVYYIKNPEHKIGGGQIEFLNSRNDYNIHKHIGGIAFASSLRVSPEEGFMIIFPSTLLHLVHPNNSNEDRISLAWNISFEKK